MDYPRTLDLATLAQSKSLFLFGPRSTGKSTLIRAQFGEAVTVNLLRSSVFLELSQRPSNLADLCREIARNSPLFVIDEIQKLPQLLDEVHHLIETTKLHFVLTGSSARKLRRSGVNLLAGRAWQANLFPLTSAELGEVDLDRYLLYGGLPQVVTSALPLEELDAYVNTYLKEEIKEEALVQNFAHFSRFLKVAALGNTEQLNFAKVSQDTGIAASSVRSYFEVLTDTFIGFQLEPWQGATSRKAVATSKFYFFDVGVANFLRGNLTLPRHTQEFGKSLEHFIAMELRAWLSYRRLKKPLSYWRTQTGIEVDFIVGDGLAIEVKSTSKVTDSDLKGLRVLRKERPDLQAIVVSQDEVARQTADGIRVLPWRQFLTELWAGGVMPKPA
ncbi:MAG: ATP-binding protein [Spirochaetales bacterium]